MGVFLIAAIASLWIIIGHQTAIDFIIGACCLCGTSVLVILAVVKIYIPFKDFKKTYINIEKNKKNAYEGTSVLTEQKSVFEWIKDIVIWQEKTEIENVRIELMVLQNQINPHFLYNTLESIRSDALYAGLDTLAETARTLAAFFRYTISESKDVYPVSYELDNIKNYFTIQEYRFGDRLKMQIEFNSDMDEILQCEIPKLTLQPIVENAILHGLEPKRKEGIITISFALTEIKLIISIKDNGLGMTGEKVEMLNESLKEMSLTGSRISTVKHGVALRNINNRIKLLFGSDYGMRVFSELGKGTQINIIVPKIKEDE